MTKQKLSSKQFLLIVNGPSCGGKSSVSNIIFEKYGGIFNANSDRIKWLISDYEATTHRNIVHKMTLELIKVALKEGLSILKEGGLFNPEEVVQIAKDHDIPLFIANISAPKEVLDQRFLERIEAKKNGAKISNVDPERFNELFEMYLDTKMDSPLEFDSSVQTPEQISTAITDYIQTHI
jgi:predicted kinase